MKEKMPLTSDCSTHPQSFQLAHSRFTPTSFLLKTVSVLYLGMLNIETAIAVSEYKVKHVR